MFRRAFEMGSAFFALTQKRAESMLKDLADSGESAQEQAQKVVDEAVEKGRQRTVELVDLVRSEIRAQVEALGLATKDDIARLEAKLDAATRGGAPASGAAKSGAAKSGAARSTGSKSTGSKSTGSKSTGSRSAAKGPSAPGARGGGRRGPEGATPGSGPDPEGG
jgi:polyhydroxyalkanoate synthesis regulator phasin